MDVVRVAEGLWRWTTYYEEWRQDVGCTYYEAADAIVLIDPLVPAEPVRGGPVLGGLDRDVKRAGVPVHVLVTVFWHTRSSAEVVGPLRRPAARRPPRPRGDRAPGARRHGRVPPRRAAAGRRRGARERPRHRGRLLDPGAPRPRPGRRHPRRRRRRPAPVPGVVAAGGRGPRARCALPWSLCSSCRSSACSSRTASPCSRTRAAEAGRDLAGTSRLTGERLAQRLDGDRRAPPRARAAGPRARSRARRRSRPRAAPRRARARRRRDARRRRSGRSSSARRAGRRGSSRARRSGPAARRWKPVSLAWTWKIASPSARTQASGSIPCQNRWEGSKFTPTASPAASRSRSIDAVL